jgi:DNA-nicking Smr family endonuclease
MARQLSPEEAELWDRVTATIKPLSREKSKAEDLEKTKKTLSSQRPDRTLHPRSEPVMAPVRPRVGSTLDGSWDKRLRSGDLEPDRVLDLHGMTLDSAWRAIDRGLEQAIAAGDRVILLITGHRPGDPPVQRGRIRAAVHDWLAVSRHASRIAAVRGAHRRHGGGGSLYLVLRRR